jgi:hypothetical protein
MEHPMEVVQQTVIVEDSQDVALRLRDFDLSVPEVMQIAIAAADASRSETSFDAPGFGGSQAHFYGVRMIRLILCPKGWTMEKDDNIPATVSPHGELVILYQNALVAGVVAHEPRPRNTKGAGAQRLVDSNQGAWFDLDGWEQRRATPAVNDNRNVYYLCVQISDDGLGVELSRPKRIDDGQFNEFHERIIIHRPTDALDPIRELGLDDDDRVDEDEFEVVVTPRRG